MEQGNRTPDQIATERIGAISEALKQLLKAGMDEAAAYRVLQQSFPDFKGAFAGVSDGTKKQLEGAYAEVTKLRPDTTLATKGGRWAVILKAANAHGIGETEEARTVDYLEHHTDAHLWHNMAVGGEAEITKPPVQKAVGLRTVRERALERLDTLARQKMASDNLDFANAMDKTCMSGEGRELWELSADVYASDRTVTEFRKTLAPTHQRFAGGANESYRQRISKRVEVL